jgi:hypothetical protein
MFDAHPALKGKNSRATTAQGFSNETATPYPEYIPRSIHITIVANFAVPSMKDEVLRRYR